MVEFQRKGHWRTLGDGSRTWVSGHDVLRTKQVTHGVDDAAVERRIAEKVGVYHKRKEEKRKKRANGKTKRANRKVAKPFKRIVAE